MDGINETSYNICEMKCALSTRGNLESQIKSLCDKAYHCNYSILSSIMHIQV